MATSTRPSGRWGAKRARARTAAPGDAPRIGAGAALFQLDRVEVERGGRSILSVPHLAVSPTGVTAVTGPSGSGKSTLLRLCNRLEVPNAGSVRFRGGDLGGIDPLQLRRKVGMVFQRPALFGGSVRDNLAVAAADRDRAAYAAALSRVGLDPELLDRPAAALSGGEAQRACIARTLLTQPEVLLLDEPTSALDASSRQRIETLAAALVADGIPLLWVTHDVEQLLSVADRVVVVERGHVAFDGDVGELHGDARLMAQLRGEEKA